MRIPENKTVRVAIFALIIFALPLSLEISYRLYKVVKYYVEWSRMDNPMLERLRMRDRQEYGLKPNSSLTTKEGLTYRINSRGLRNYEYTYEKGEGVYRILMFGDSYVFGWGSRLEDAFPKILERTANGVHKNRKFEVLNFGVLSYNTAQEYEFLKKEALKYEPDMVILAFVVNDAEPIFNMSQNPVSQYMGVKLWFPEFVKYRLNTAIVRLFKKDSFFRLKREGFSYHFTDAFQEDSPTAWKKRECMEALGGMHALLERNGVEFLVIILPSLNYMQMDSDYPPYEKYSYKIINDTVRNFCRVRNIRVLDLYDTFAGVPVSEIKRPGEGGAFYSHINERGYAMLVAGMFKLLSKDLE